MSYYKTVTKVLTNTQKQSLYVNDAAATALVYGLVFNCTTGVGDQPIVSIYHKTLGQETLLMTSTIGEFTTTNINVHSTPYTLTFPKPIALTNQGDELLVQASEPNLVSCLCSVFVDTSLDTSIRSAGVWSNTKQYNLNNLVYYNGVTYIASTSSTTTGSVPSSTPSEWTPFSLQTEYRIINGDGINSFSTSYSNPTATVSVADILSNKTLVNPSFTSFKRLNSDSNVIIIPDSNVDDTLCLVSEAQTLINKTLTTPNLDKPNIAGYKENITTINISDVSYGSAINALNLINYFSTNTIININITATSGASNTTWITLGDPAVYSGRSFTVIITASNISTGTSTSIKFAPTSNISFSNSYQTDPTWTISSNNKSSIFVFLSNGVKWFGNVAGEGF